MIDTHTHIFADQKQYPLWSGRVYTPEEALPPEMKSLHKALHMERVVIVNPSIYGTDNRASLYGMKAYGPGARGVAVIDDKTPDSELDSMHQAGMRGIRINLATQNQTDPGLGRKRLIDSGAEPAPGTPAELAALVKTDGVKWGRIIRDKKIVGE